MKLKIQIGQTEKIRGIFYIGNIGAAFHLSRVDSRDGRPKKEPKEGLPYTSKPAQTFFFGFERCPINRATTSKLPSLPAQAKACGYPSNP